MDEKLKSRWLDYKISNKQEIMDNLEFPYKDSATKYFFVEALVFWKFVHEGFKDFGLGWIFWEERQLSLLDFMSSRNPYIGIVAMVESLPTNVWRKILWKHNIDFMSFESFLRRLDPVQMTAISQNYQDLYQYKKVPRVYSGWNRFWGRLSVEKLFMDDSSYEERYVNKGAMSYNLLGLDFGFNAYPKGLTDDTKVVEISPLRFLSVKNHADDFVVNTETGGKYFWLYRTARSNYVIRPNKDVTLNKHICPGFWLTMLVHLLFWVVSPIFSVAMGAAFMTHQHWVTTVGLGFVGAVTPLWLMAAVVKFFFVRYFPGCCEVVDDFFSKYGRYVKFTILAVIVLVVCLFALSVILLVYEFFAISFGPYWSAAIIAAFGLYVGQNIYAHEKKEKYCATVKFPLYFLIPILVVVGKIVVQFFQTYPWPWTFLLPMLLWIWNSFLFVLPFVAVVAPPVALLAYAFMMKDVDSEKQEVIYNRINTAIMYLTYVMLACSLGLIAYVWKMDVDFFQMRLLVFVGVVAFIAFLVSGFIVKYADPKVKEAYTAIDFLHCNLKFLVREKLIRNKWFVSLGTDEKVAVLERVCKFLDSNCLSIHDALRILAPCMTQELLDVLFRHELDFRYLRNGTDIRVFERMVVRGLSFEKALEEVVREERRMDELERRLKYFYALICLPISFLWKMIMTLFVFSWKMILAPLCKFVAKIFEYSKTLYRLYEHFNKRCPYVVERKVLRF